MRRSLSVVRLHLKRLFKFAVVGFFGALINLLLLVVLTEWCHLHYVLSEILAMCVAVIWNYVGNTKWTYSDAMKRLES